MFYTVFKQDQFGTSTDLQSFENLDEALFYLRTLTQNIKEPASTQQRFEFYTLRVNF